MEQFEPDGDMLVEASIAVVDSISEGDLRQLVQNIIQHMIMDGCPSVPTDVWTAVCQSITAASFQQVDEQMVGHVVLCAQAALNMLPGHREDEVTLRLAQDTVHRRMFEGVLVL